MEEQVDIHQTIFEPYLTVIFDLDAVLWDCFQPNGQSTGCFTAVAPFKREAGNIVTSSNGVVIRLQEGIEGLLKALDEANKNLGIVSKSEAPGVTISAQPAIMLLKQYDIYKYFNYDVIIKADIEKSHYVKANGKTLFIDDDQQNLEEVKQKDDVDVLWRKSFVNWDQTLSPVQSHLNLSFMKLGWEMLPPKVPYTGDKIKVLKSPEWYEDDLRGEEGVIINTGTRFDRTKIFWIDLGGSVEAQFPIKEWQKYFEVIPSNSVSSSLKLIG